MRKGQSAMETMMAMGVLLVFIALLYSFVIYPRMDQIDRARTRSLAQDVCSDLSTAINAAAYNGNGFSQAVNMPATIGGVAYNATVYLQAISIEWDKGEIFCQFRAKNVTYGALPAPFSLDISRKTVTNDGGVVRLA